MRIFEVENNLDNLKWFSMDDEWTDGYPTIKHIGRAINATHWANWGRISVPWSSTEMIGGSGTYILKTPDGHVMLDASPEFRKGKMTHISLSQISVENRSSGIGTKVMNAIKQYADAKGIGVVVYKVTNQQFFDKFSWLTPDEYKSNYYYNY